MSPVLAVYGREDILGYVRGTLEDDEEMQEIEGLVGSDPRAATIVCKLQMIELGDEWTLDISACRRLRRLQKIAKNSGMLAKAMH